MVYWTFLIKNGKWYEIEIKVEISKVSTVETKTNMKTHCCDMNADKDIITWWRNILFLIVCSDANALSNMKFIK